MKTLFTLFLLHAFTATIAQRGYKNPVFVHEKEKSVAKFMKAEFYKNYQHNLDTMCLYTAFYAVFEISETGKVANLKFTASLPELLRPSVEQMIYATEGHWHPAMQGKKALRSRPFMLPVYCRLFNEDCVDVKNTALNSTWFMFRYDKTKPLIGGYMYHDVDSTFEGTVLHPIEIGNQITGVIKKPKRDSLKHRRP
jgi:hypothetical protein